MDNTNKNCIATNALPDITVRQS
uniref:Uncharacterized protein n=1 Tax=Arundo donax TaxID=35708 RepID=A0A0A9B3U7_ARUDO